MFFRHRYQVRRARPACKAFTGLTCSWSRITLKKISSIKARHHGDSLGDRYDSSLIERRASKHGYLIYQRPSLPDHAMARTRAIWGIKRTPFPLAQLTLSVCVHEQDITIMRTHYIIWTITVILIWKQQYAMHRAMAWALAGFGLTLVSGPIASCSPNTETALQSHVLSRKSTATVLLAAKAMIARSTCYLWLRVFTVSWEQHWQHGQ